MKIDANFIQMLANTTDDPDDPFLDALFMTYMMYVSTRLNYYNFLGRLVLHRKPKVALELGVEFGLASAHMASAATVYGGRVIGVDKHFHHVPGHEIDKMYGNYDFVLGGTLAIPTILRVKDFVDLYGPIGLIFQDSSHHYSESVQEWEAYSPMLDEHAILVCDDITPSFHDPKVDPPGKGMVQYFEELPGEKILFPDILHKGNTIGVVLL